MLGNFNIIFNDIDIKKINQHPVRFSKNTKIFNFTYIDNKIAESCFNYLLHYSKLRYNQLYELEYWPYHPFYLPQNLVKCINNINIIKIKNHNCDANLCYKNIKKSDNGFCDVYKTEINDSSYYEFNCGHKFMIDNFNHFNQRYLSCFTCQTPICSIKNFINSKTAIDDLLGCEFKKIFNYDYHYYFLHCNFIDKFKFLSKIYSNLYLVNIDDLSKCNLNEKSILCICKNLSKFEIIDLLKSNCSTNQFLKIIKLSQSI